MIYHAFVFSVVILQKLQDNIRCDNRAMDRNDNLAVCNVSFSDCFKLFCHSLDI